MKAVCDTLLKREGRRWDNLFMGILREEWLELNASVPAETAIGT